MDNRFFVPKLDVVEETPEEDSYIHILDIAEENEKNGLNHSFLLIELAKDNDSTKNIPLSILPLNLLDSNIALNKSYSISAKGDFQGRGFSINSDGLNKTPDKVAPFLGFTFPELFHVRSVGRGASGSVSLTFHTVTYDIIALKGVGIMSSTERHQILNELQALLKLSSPYVINIFGARTHETKIEIALEYMNRGSILDVLQLVHKIPEECLKHLAKQAVLGLAFLHSSKQVHRDVKPANLLLNSFGQLKFADFGIASELSSTNQLCSTVCGTIHYLSPERIRSEEYGPSADIWSLGLVLYTCATGEFPYNDEGGYFGLYNSIQNSPSPKIPNSFSNEFRDFVGKCLEKDKTKRAKSSELLIHPWIVDVSEVCSSETLDLLTSYRKDFIERDLSDLRVILRSIAETYSKKNPYIRSLFEIAKFDKIGRQLGMKTKDVIKEFELIYDEMHKSK